VRKAIRKSVPRRKEGIEFQELPELVARALPPGEQARLGSVLWYTVTVKLHMEVTGELERVPGASPQRVRLKR